MMELDFAAKSIALRRDIVDMIVRAKAGHIGGDLSVLDILIVLYYQVMHISPEGAEDPDRDRFVLSKGHSVEALYVVLADRGFFQKQELERYCTFGSPLIGHPSNKVRGIEMNTGALGHGLPVGVGMALAARADARNYRTYVVMGDGELAEGSSWEAIMAAAHFRLNNLCLVIDRNGLQISGDTETVMSQEDMPTRFRAFGWHVIETDGHDHAALRAAFEAAQNHRSAPSVVIARTVKGKGISFIENRAGWHHRIPSEEEYRLALTELQESEGRMQG